MRGTRRFVRLVPPSEDTVRTPDLRVDVTADGTLAGAVRPALAADAQAGRLGRRIRSLRLARAMTPEPGAWALFRGDRLKLGPVTVVDEPALAPGELRVERKRVLAGTATSPVRLGEVQAQGKKRMAATDWARGTRIEQGERLG